MTLGTAPGLPGGEITSVVTPPGGGPPESAPALADDTVAPSSTLSERLRKSLTHRPREVDVPASPGQQSLSVLLATVSAVILALILNLVVISPVQHLASQAALYEDLRLSLAEGSSPLGPIGADGELIAPGTPLAVLEAPAVGLDREVIVEGSAGAQTMLGIGHRRDTPMPCQSGSSVLMARAAAYGGPGGRLAELGPGDEFGVTMGQGECTYKVIGQRSPGDDAPPAPLEGEGRLILTTASGLPFMPDEALRIDAELVGDAVDRTGTVLPTGALPESESAMGTDQANLFPLVLLLQVLVVAVIGVLWLWRRWGRLQTWIVAVPVIGSIGLVTATALNQWLLPNLL